MKKDVIFKEIDEIIDIINDIQEIGLDREEEQAFLKIIDLMIEEIENKEGN